MSSAPDIFVAIGVSSGRKAKLARVTRDWTQAEVAVAADVTPADVSCLERDLYVYPKARERIFVVLGLDEDGR